MSPCPNIHENSAEERLSEGLRELYCKALSECGIKGNIQNLVRRVIGKRAANNLLRIDIDTRRRLGNVQETYAGELDTESITKVARNRELAVCVGELDERRRLRRNRDTIVRVQLTGSSVVRARCDDELEVGRSESLCGHRNLLAQREDSATLDVDRNRREVNVVEGYVGALTLERYEREEVVKDVLGEVGRNGGRVLVGYGGHEDGIAVKELKVDGEGIAILGVLVPKRVQNWGAVSVSLVERSVDVIHQAVAADMKMS